MPCGGAWSLHHLAPRPRETRADGSYTTLGNKLCTGSDCNGAATVSIMDTRNAKDERIALPAVTFADSAGHPLRTQTWDMDGDVLYVDQAVDVQGRVYKTYRPRKATELVSTVSKIGIIHMPISHL